MRVLGVSRRVGSMHPLQIVEQRVTDEMSAGHSLLIVCVIPSPEIHASLRKPLLSQGHFEIPHSLVFLCG